MESSSDCCIANNCRNLSTVRSRENSSNDSKKREWVKNTQKSQSSKCKMISTFFFSPYFYYYIRPKPLRVLNNKNCKFCYYACSSFVFRCFCLRVHFCGIFSSRIVVIKLRIYLIFGPLNGIFFFFFLQCTHTN